MAAAQQPEDGQERRERHEDRRGAEGEVAAEGREAVDLQEGAVTGDVDADPVDDALEQKLGKAGDSQGAGEGGDFSKSRRPDGGQPEAGAAEALMGCCQRW